MVYKQQEIMMEVYLLRRFLMMKLTPIIFMEIGRLMSIIKTTLIGDLMMIKVIWHNELWHFAKEEKKV